MNPIDQDFVQLFNKGDRGAFKLLYEKLSPGLFHFTRKIIGNREEAEDILAETFLKLWLIPKTFETIQHIDAFLHVTSKNACFDRIRRSKMELTKKEIVLENVLKSYENEADDQEIKEILLNRIYAEVEKLPTKSKDVIKLSFIEDLRNPEIARRLSTNEKTVRNQKATALKRLRIGILKKIGF